MNVLHIVVGVFLISFALGGIGSLMEWW